VTIVVGLPTEETVRNVVTVWLNSTNYDLVSLSSTYGRPRIARRRGRPRSVKPPDIIAKRREQNYYYFIEVKGDPASKKKLYEVIGEIVVQRARTTPARYGIALPMSYKPLILDVLSTQAWKQGGFYLLLVKDQNVTELRATLQNFDRLGRLR
jgi:hypothetical protein